MTDPTIQATRVEVGEGDDIISAQRVQIRNLYSHTDEDFIRIEWDETAIDMWTKDALAFTEGIDTISGGAYRARIERETLETLRDEYANTGTFIGTFLMQGVPVIGDDLDVVLQRKIDALRAQQPSDPARETQGEVTT